MKPGKLGLLGLALLLVHASASFAAEPGFTSLFNGHDLSGWEEDTRGLW